MRKDTLWNLRNGTYMETVKPTGYDILINGTDKYLNWGSTSGTSGYGIRDNGGTMEFKNSGGAWTGFGSGGGGVGPGTINEIAYFDTTTTVNSLPVATYPSLTELSYVKGVTSAIQTQFTGKANTALSNLAGVAINTSLISDTTKTDDLGSSTIKWRNTYTENVYADTIGYNSLRAVFGERKIYINEFTDALWRANRRFTVTQSGAGTLANLFDGDFESNLTVPVSTTNVINIYVENQSGVPVNGFTYPEGKIYVHFYYTNNNYSAISMRAKQNGVWYSLGTPTDISTVASDKVLEFPVSGQNYLTDIELTITTNGTDQVLITAINYVMDRWTSQAEVPYFDKFASINNILGTVNFRTTTQTTSASINADGDWYMGVGGTGGHFGIGTSTPGVYHLNVAGDILGNSIYTASGNIFGSLGIAYLRAGSTNPTHINDTASGDVNICVGGGDLGVGEQYPTNRLHVKALSATTSYNLLNIDGGATGFSGANDTGAYSIIFSGCAYQTSIVQVIGAKIQFEKANTWNYADTPTGTRSIVNFYASAGTPNSPTSVKFLSGYYDNTVRLPSLDTDATAPTTSGTTKMVITDANGQLSFADIPGGYTNLTQFVAQTAWRIFYSDGSGDVQELALGGAGTYLQSAGASSVPTWATPAGSGDVVKVGTPVNNQVGVWTGDGTLEGDADLTFDTSTNTLATGIVTVTDDAYAAGWNGSTAVPTKNAIYDKIESMAGISRTQVTTSGSLTLGSTSATDYVYYVAGAHTLSMPSPNNNRYTIKNNHSANITIDTAGAELIEGAASISIAPGSSVDVVSDTTNWYIV